MCRVPTDDEYRRLAAFRSTMRRFMRFSEIAARDAGITPAQHQLLLAVRGWSGDGDPAIADVTEMLQRSPHSVLELAGRAEEDGLLRRMTPEHDHRQHALRLTDRGERVLASLTVLHRDELDRIGDEIATLLRHLE
jgi:DNA-binding MarR family transcriptional regulator